MNIIQITFYLGIACVLYGHYLDKKTFGALSKKDNMHYNVRTVRTNHSLVAGALLYLPVVILINYLKIKETQTKDDLMNLLSL